MPADPPTPTDARGMLLARFGEIRAQLEKDARYYDRRRWWTMVLSYATLAIAVAAFCLGSVAPFMESVWPFAQPEAGQQAAGATFWERWRIGDWLAFGYLALVVAGLALVVDNTLLATRNWGRFVLAKLGIEALAAELANDRLMFEVTTPDAALTPAKVEETLDLLKSYGLRRDQLLTAETTSWATETLAARDAFSLRIASVAGKTDEQIETRAAAVAEAQLVSTAGAVVVTFADPPAGVTKLIAMLGAETREEDAVPRQLAFRIAPGVHILTLRWQVGDVWSSAEVPVVVKTGETSSTTVSLA